MAFTVDIPFTGTMHSPFDREKTFDYFANFDSAVAKHFPGLERFEASSEDVYDWAFKKVEYSSYSFDVSFRTRFIQLPHESIQIQPIPGIGNCSLSGRWEFSPEGKGTQIALATNLTMELPFSRLIKAMAAPITQKEITKLFERYTQNVNQALSA